MICMGILGGEEFKVLELVLEFFERKKNKLLWEDLTDCNFELKSALERAKQKQADVLLLLMDLDTIHYFKTERFTLDVLVIFGGIFGKENKCGNLCDIMAEKSTVIANCDDKSIFPFSISPKTSLITCGINSKASVTASSVSSNGEVERIICCIQRTLETHKGIVLEPQEFPVDVYDTQNDISRVLTAVATAMVDDMELSLFEIESS